MKPEELERSLGRNLRAQRIARRLTQAELATSADVSLGALRNLERGNGSTTSTFLQVLRALELDEWIAKLAPATAFNPLDLLDPRRQVGRGRPTQRVRHRSGSRT